MARFGDRVIACLLRGQGLADRLADPRWIDDWSALADRCPWATVYQRPAFVRPWYQMYGDRLEPVVVEVRDDANALIGLLPLAADTDEGTLTGAGTHHAEYHGWLALPENATASLTAGLAALRTPFPNGTLTLGPLWPSAPLDWITGSWRAAIEQRSTFQGSIAPGAEDAAASLRKKSNKSRLNRLRRHGELAFETVTDGDRFETVLDALIPLVDLRQGAVHGLMPFAGDPTKRPFHRALFDAGLLHVTELRVGDRLVSAQLNVRNRDEVILCVIGHSPTFAKHSPGKFHLLFLLEALAAEGIARFDLSPGDDEYKRRTATIEDQVTTLRIRLGGRAHAGTIPTALRASVKRVLASTGMDPATLRRRWEADGWSPSPGGGLGRAARLAAEHLGLSTRVGVYRHPGGADSAGVVAPVRDAIEDLLDYPAADGRPSRRAFLRRALAGLEAGGHTLTNGAVPGPWACARILPPGEEVLFEEVGQRVRTPDTEPILVDVLTNRGNYATWLRACLHAVGGGAAYLAVPSWNRALAAAALAEGWRQEGGFGRRVWLGKETAWAEGSPLPVLVDGRGGGKE